jgi:hypothetical protein
MHEALKRYCAVFHPEIKNISSMPFWLVRMLATLTRSQGLKGIGEMMAYFEKVGETGGPANADDILGVPTITLDVWLEKRKAGPDTSAPGRTLEYVQKEPHETVRIGHDLPVAQVSARYFGIQTLRATENFPLPASQLLIIAS